jgi:hypothetical protein
MLEIMLDWIVAMDLQHYQTQLTPDYTPSGPSHWYVKGAPERFTSAELISIYQGKMSEEVRDRWNWALTDKRK